MAKQSICKRTRSKSKQTSLLDFEVPKKQRRASGTRTIASKNGRTHPSSNDGDSSCDAAADTSTKRRVTQSGGRPSVAATDTKELSIQLKLTSGKRRRSSGAAAAKPSTALSQNDVSRDENISAPAADSVDANDVVAATKRRKKRDTVFFDVTVAPRPIASTSARSRPIAEKDAAKEDPDESSMDRLGADTSTAQMKQSAITPSPDALARKEAAEKNAVASDPFGGTSMLGKADSGESSTSTSPSADLFGDAEKEGTDGNVNSAGLDSITEPSDNMWRQQKTQHSDQQTTIATPAFHHPWKPPYQAAVSPDGTLRRGSSSVPEGVIDIDTMPHTCCLHSNSSHAGYSWITSKRRCGCFMDSNHNSSESMTESYLGSYGVDRYREVGSSGIVGTNVNENDWKVERWWLDQTRKELEATAAASDTSSKRLLQNRGDVTRLETKKEPAEKSDNEEQDDGRTLSPTSALSDTSTSDEASAIPLSTAQPDWSRLLPSTIEKHLDYMSRQPHITVEMRRILMDWLSEVADEYKLCTETLWLSVTLVDRCLACSYSKDCIDGWPANSRKKSGNKAISSECIVGPEMVTEKEKIQLLGW